jgi:hypothetical protein
MSDDLHTLLAEYEGDHQGARPNGLTASGLHPVCHRQTAYDLNGYEPTNETDPVSAATVGTMLHETYEKLWRAHDPDALVEVRGVHGQADVVRLHTDPPEIRDLKTKGKRGFDWWVNNGKPDDTIWDQLAIYAHDNNLPDDAELVIDALCRDTGRTAEYRLLYQVEHGERVVRELEALSASLTDVDPLDVETGKRRGAHGREYFCPRCPWVDACLDDAGRPTGVVRDIGDVF